MTSIHRGVARFLTALAITIALTVLIAASTIHFVTGHRAVGAQGISNALASSALQFPRHLPRVMVNTDPASLFLNTSLPLLTQTRLIASDGALGNNLGSAVAISGNTAAVADDSSVYVFMRSNGIWTQQQKLSSAGTQYVAIDGNTLVSASGTLCHVFVRNGNVWTSQQVIDLGNLTFSVSVSDDTIVAGIPWDSEGCPATSPGYRGAALVFARNGGVWTQQQKLTASDGACAEDPNRPSVYGVAPYSHPGDFFGESVSVDHDAILVGAGNARMGANVEAGAAYVFGRNGNAWSEQQKLRSSSPSLLGHFGSAVAISDTSAVIGAPSDTGALGSPYQPGSADAFGRSNGIWTAQQHFAAGVSPNCTYNFARSVAVSGDTIVVACNTDYPPDDPSSPPLPIGSASWFRRSGSSWIQQTPLRASDGVQGDNFGNAVAVSGPTILVGARRDDTTAGPDAGSAYAYEIDGFIDPTPPVLTVPANITTNATSASGAIVQFVVTATDNDDPNPVVVSVPASGSLFPIGVTTVHNTATDASGNSASADFPVNVLDPTPTPTPNPCLTQRPAASGILQKSVTLGSAPASNPNKFDDPDPEFEDVIGGPQNLLFRYTPSNPDSPCATDAAELHDTSNVALLKQSRTTWVRLWVDWAALQPYSPSEVESMPESCKEPVRNRTVSLLENLDKQIRIAQKEGLHVILVVNHRYPLWTNDSRIKMPLPSPASGCLVQTCEQQCGVDEKCKNRCRKQADPKGRRDAFGKVPTNLFENSPWSQFISFLVERYGVTNNKIDPYRQPCSHNFNGEGCEDYLRYVDFLEIVNEPNLTHWPQRDPDKNEGRLVMPGLVALMFRTAKATVNTQNVLLVSAGKLKPGTTTVKLLGPATSDGQPSERYKSTTYDDFTRELLKRLKAMPFHPGPDFAWSHHNYGDVEYLREGLSRTQGGRLLDPSNCATNSAAWVRRLLVVGESGYTWKGWPVGDNNPGLLITESGARLAKLIDLWNINPNRQADLESQQALLVGVNFNDMKTGRLSSGIAMVNNYLTYSDPIFDTGMLDFLSSDRTCNPWLDRAICDNPRKGDKKDVACIGKNRRVRLCVCSATDMVGDRRPLYRVWTVLQPSP